MAGVWRELFITTVLPSTAVFFHGTYRGAKSVVPRNTTAGPLNTALPGIPEWEFPVALLPAYQGSAPGLRWGTSVPLQMDPLTFLNVDAQMSKIGRSKSTQDRDS